MATVRVSVGGESGSGGYDVRIGAGLLGTLGEMVAAVAGAHRYAIIADSNVAPLYGATLLEAIEGKGGAGELLVFPAGESNKNRESWIDLSDRLLRSGFGRDSAILALGGGVTGDLAGFVAATYLRGLPLIQLPTSLLAMIDSSVGGKTGVDTPAGKNLIGSFHQPLLVVADTTTLGTLPASELRSGLAEAVKHGAITDRAYFDWIGDNLGALTSLDSASLEHLVERSVQIKARVVALDEREGGLRKILNFGHTIGHAVEALSDFQLLHGEAIAIGMVVEARIGEALGVTRSGSGEQLRQLLDSVGLPTAVPHEFHAADVLNRTRLDKKARAGRVEYALIEEIGAASPGTGGFGTPVDDASVIAAIEICR